MSRSPRVIRSTLAVLAVAGTLLVATPAQGQAAGPPVRAGEAQPADWTEEAFPAGNARLYDAARVDADTTWAVGSRAYGEGRQRYSGPVIFSRDDDSRSWTDVPVPDGYSGTSAVAADPAGNIWVAGSNSPDDKGIPTARRDATGWDVLPEAPVPEGTLSAGFAHLAPVADDDVWAAGYRQPEGILTFDAMIGHWGWVHTAAAAALGRPLLDPGRRSRPRWHPRRPRRTGRDRAERRLGGRRRGPRGPT